MSIDTYAWICEQCGGNGGREYTNGEIQMKKKREKLKIKNNIETHFQRKKKKTNLQCFWLD